MEDSSAAPPKIVLTAASSEELKEIETDLVNQGWNSEGTVTENPDGTYSVTLNQVS